MKQNNFIFTLIDYRELWIHRKIFQFILIYLHVCKYVLLQAFIAVPYYLHYTLPIAK